jgi:protocatechuate 3,4-dioxygenase beta subunit
LLPLILVAIVVAGVLIWRAAPAPAPATPAAPGAVPASPAIEQRYGVRINMVGVTADGGLLDLRFTVLDATSCAPIKDAAVDVWHCDASGVYSGFGSAGGAPRGGPGGGGSGATNNLTFLRGTQVSDANGVAVFRTIYPGWYPGRAVHIHLKVHIGGSVVHTGQVFFADSVNDTAYKASPYNTRPTPDVRNAADSIYRQAGGKAAELDVAPNGSGYTGSINLGVKRSSTAGSSRS